MEITIRGVTCCRCQGRRSRIKYARSIGRVIEQLRLGGVNAYFDFEGLAKFLHVFELTFMNGFESL